MEDDKNTSKDTGQEFQKKNNRKRTALIIILSVLACIIIICVFCFAKGEGGLSIFFNVSESSKDNDSSQGGKRIQDDIKIVYGGSLPFTFETGYSVLHEKYKFEITSFTYSISDFGVSPYNVQCRFEGRVTEIKQPTLPGQPSRLPSSSAYTVLYYEFRERSPGTVLASGSYSFYTMLQGSGTFSFTISESNLKLEPGKTYCIYLVHTFTKQ